jgi:hypothetical protein
MFHELFSVDEHERVHVAAGDEPGCEHGFSEGGCGREHAGIVGEHRLGRLSLAVPQVPMKLHVQRRSDLPEIPECERDPVGREQ